jgi:hypothetical protein
VLVSLPNPVCFSRVLSPDNRSLGWLVGARRSEGNGRHGMCHKMRFMVLPFCLLLRAKEKKKVRFYPGQRSRRDCLCAGRIMLVVWACRRLAGQGDGGTVLSSSGAPRIARTARAGQGSAADVLAAAARAGGTIRLSHGFALCALWVLHGSSGASHPAAVKRRGLLFFASSRRFAIGNGRKGPHSVGSALGREKTRANRPHRPGKLLEPRCVTSAPPRH